MNQVEQILESWDKNISGYRKLKLNEAQLLYKEMINSEEKRKELLREKLITGTLYLIPNFIRGSLLPYIKNNCYDMNDIINACNEVWINVIDSGKLLEVSFYSQLFGDVFYKEIITGFAFDYNLHNETGGNAIFFFELLSWYINESINGKEINYKLFLDYINNLLKKVDSRHAYFSIKENLVSIYSIIVNIYQHLIKNGFVKSNVSVRQLELLKNLLLDNVYESMNVNANEIKVDDYSMIYSNYVLETEILNCVFNNSSLKQKEKDILRYRYGIDDGVFKTLEDTGKVFGLTKAGVGMLEGRVFNKIENVINPLLEDYFYLEPKKRSIKLV